MLALKNWFKKRAQANEEKLQRRASTQSGKDATPGAVVLIRPEILAGDDKVTTITEPTVTATATSTTSTTSTTTQPPTVKKFSRKAKRMS
ncbi:hypothetical protein HK104_001472, partial [Borealophlyctis nickersoniae]